MTACDNQPLPPVVTSLHEEPISPKTQPVVRFPLVATSLYKAPIYPKTQPVVRFPPSVPKALLDSSRSPSQYSALRDKSNASLSAHNFTPASSEQPSEAVNLTSVVKTKLNPTVTHSSSKTDVNQPKLETTLIHSNQATDLINTSPFKGVSPSFTRPPPYPTSATIPRSKWGRTINDIESLIRQNKRKREEEAAGLMSSHKLQRLNKASPNGGSPFPAATERDNRSVHNVLGGRKRSSTEEGAVSTIAPERDSYIKDEHEMTTSRRDGYSDEILFEIGAHAWEYTPNPATGPVWKDWGWGYFQVLGHKIMFLEAGTGVNIVNIPVVRRQNYEVICQGVIQVITVTSKQTVWNFRLETPNEAEKLAQILRDNKRG